MFSHFCKRVLLSCLLLQGAFGAPSVFGAGAPLDTFGFEGYTPGSLVGQPAAPSSPYVWNGNEVDENGSPTSTNIANGATIQSTVVYPGSSKALRVNRAPAVHNRWAVPFGNTPVVMPSHRFVLVDWDMNVVGTGADDASGPFFGVEAYDDQGVFGLLGSLGVDATSSEVIYQLQDTAFFENTGATINFDVWNHFGMVFDFTAHEYAVYMNGTRLKTTGFVDRGLSHTALDRLTDADISALGAYGMGPSLTITGTAYFDNFRVLDGVPGDFDFDGDVDGPDLGTWRGAVRTSAAADADGDGDSDGADFLIWQQNQGADVTPIVAAGAVVPEPAGVALAAIGVASLFAARRRSRR